MCVEKGTHKTKCITIIIRRRGVVINLREASASKTSFQGKHAAQKEQKKQKEAKRPKAKKFCRVRA